MMRMSHAAVTAMSLCALLGTASYALLGPVVILPVTVIVAAIAVVMGWRDAAVSTPRSSEQHGGYISIDVASVGLGGLGAYVTVWGQAN